MTPSKAGFMSRSAWLVHTVAKGEGPTSVGVGHGGFRCPRGSRQTKTTEAPPARTCEENSGAGSAAVGPTGGRWRSRKVEPSPSPDGVRSQALRALTEELERRARASG